MVQLTASTGPALISTADALPTSPLIAALGLDSIVGTSPPVNRAATQAASATVTQSAGPPPTTPTASLVDSVAVSGLPGGIAVSPDGGAVYVAGLVPGSGGTVDVIDGATDEVTTTIPLGSDMTPVGAAVSPDGQRLYVVTYEPQTAGMPGSVLVIDTASNTVVGNPIPVGSYATSALISPDGHHLYVGGLTPGSADSPGVPGVSVLDTTTNTVTGSIPTTTPPTFMAISPDGANLYVADIHADSSGVSPVIKVVNTASNTVTQTISVDGQVALGGLAISPDNSRLYALVLADSQNTSLDVAVIDTTSGATVDTIAGVAPVSFLGAGPGIALSGDGSRLYVPSVDSATYQASINVIDTAVGAVVGEPVSLGTVQPVRLAVGPDGTRLYAASDFGGGGVVSVVDTATQNGTGGGTGGGGGTGDGGSGGSTGGGAGGSTDENLHLWISSFGTVFDDLKVGVLGTALHVSNIFDDLYHGQFGAALFDTVQLFAGTLEKVPVLPVRGFGIFLDLSSQAAKNLFSSPPAAPGEVFRYVVTHPFGALGGATSAVVGAIGNTVGHSVGVPQVAINAVVDPAVKAINDGADTVDRAVNDFGKGVSHAFNNVVHGRWPWE